MTVSYSVDVQNAQLDALETEIGTSPVLAIFSGTIPANTAVANSGTLLATLNLPSNWLSDATAGTKSKAGTWEDDSADGTGDAGYYRIFDSSGGCHIQGTITQTSGGGDMELNNTSIATGQQITISTFTINSQNT